MRDCANKGRNRGTRNRGEKHGFSRLAEIDILTIRHWLKDGRWAQEKIAAAFEVSGATISRIKDGKSWSHVPATL